MDQIGSAPVSKFPILDIRESDGAVAYHCTRCAKIWTITRFPLAPETVKSDHCYFCPECFSSLATDFRWPAIDAKHLVVMARNGVELQEAFFARSAEAKRKAEIEFTSATNLLGLSFHAKSLEALFQGLRKGSFVVFYGSTFCHRLSEELCCRAQLSLEKGGLNSPAVFVDGGNCFDPYAVSSFARSHDLDPKTVLQNIRVSRAFTCYQLAALILEELPQVLEATDSEFVVVADFLALFDAADIEEVDARELLQEVVTTARRLCRERKILFLLTCVQRRKALEEWLFPNADVLAHFKEETNHIQVSVSKQGEGRSGTFSIPVHRVQGKRILQRIAPEIVRYG